MDAKIAEKVLPRMSEMVSLLLWDIGAVKVNIDEPFKLVSGNYSPIYINCRLAISNPTLMSLFTASSQIICEHKDIHIDVVAGGETAGIPFAAYVAQSLSLPMIYVRKARKGHGIASLIEGHITKSSNVLLVEDLITDAGSKLHFINAIRAADGLVKNVLVLFDREQGGREALRAQDIQLYSVTDLKTALDIAKEANLLPDSHLQSVKEYLKDVRLWHRKHKLSFKA